MYSLNHDPTKWKKKYIIMLCIFPKQGCRDLSTFDLRSEYLKENTSLFSISWQYTGALYQSHTTFVSALCGNYLIAWWRHQMETFFALLALCAGNSPVTGEFPTLRSVTRSFYIFFDLCLNKQLSKQSWAWWFGRPSRSLLRHCNEQIPCRLGNLYWSQVW